MWPIGLRTEGATGALRSGRLQSGLTLVVRACQPDTLSLPATLPPPFTAARRRRSAAMASVAPLNRDAGDRLSWFAFALNKSLTLCGPLLYPNTSVTFARG